MHRRGCLKGLLALAMLAGLPGAASGETSRMGRVRDLRAARWLDAAAFEARLAAASAVIVGERHDNPEHHRLERRLIETLAARRRLGGVAMEMLDHHQQPLLDARPVEALLALSDAALREALDWNPGWDWQAYGPTLRTSLARGVPVRAANLSREALRETIAAGEAPDLPAAVAATQRRALVDGHCGLLPPEALPGMLAAQVARDRVMAAALEALPATALLICGAGHARRDIGVARYLPREPLTLGLIELPPGAADWRAALPASVDAAPPFDLVWFTPSVARGDPCVELRRRFGGGDRP